MNPIKHIGLTILGVIRRAGRRRQRRVAQKEFETERLDRIRNPFKYRGK